MNTTLLITGAIAFAGALLAGVSAKSAATRNPDRQPDPLRPD